MRHRAGHTVHDKRREPTDPKFGHGVDGVADKRVEITHVRARATNHGGPRGVRAVEGKNPEVPCRHAGREGIPFLEGGHRKRLREWELVEEGVD
jgi:hypothetical protein